MIPRATTPSFIYMRQVLIRTLVHAGFDTLLRSLLNLAGLTQHHAYEAKMRAVVFMFELQCSLAPKQKLARTQMGINSAASSAGLHVGQF